MDFYNSYGYDEIFVDPLSGSSYPSYINTLIQPSGGNSDDKVASVARNENKRSNNIPFVPESEQIQKMKGLSPSPYNDVYDYLEKTVQRDNHARHSYEKKISVDSLYIEDLRKKVSDYQYKHDIFLIFIICLVVYIIIQSNSNRSQPMVYYGTPPTMFPNMMPSAPSANLL